MLSKMLSCAACDVPDNWCEDCAVRYVGKIQARAFFCRQHSSHTGYSEAINKIISSIDDVDIQKKIIDKMDSQCFCDKSDGGDIEKRIISKKTGSVVSLGSDKRNMVVEQVINLTRECGLELEFLKVIGKDRRIEHQNHNLHSSDSGTPDSTAAGMVLEDANASADLDGVVYQQNLEKIYLVLVNMARLMIEECPQDSEVQKTCKSRMIAFIHNPDAIFITLLVFNQMIDFIGDFILDQESINDNAEKILESVIKKYPVEISNESSRQEIMRMLSLVRFPEEVFFGKFDIVFLGSKIYAQLMKQGIARSKLKSIVREDVDALTFETFMSFYKSLRMRIYKKFFSGGDFNMISPVVERVKKQIECIDEVDFFTDVFVRTFGHCLLMEFCSDVSVLMIDKVNKALNTRLHQKIRRAHRGAKEKACLQELKKQYESSKAAKSAEAVVPREENNSLPEKPVHDYAPKKASMGSSELREVAIVMDRLMNQKLSHGEWKTQKKKIKKYLESDKSEKLINCMGLTEPMIRALRLLAEKYTDLDDPLTDDDIRHTYNDLHSDLKKIPYRQAAREISARLSASGQEISADRIHVKLWSILSMPGFAHGTPPDSSQATNDGSRYSGNAAPCLLPMVAGLETGDINSLLPQQATDMFRPSHEPLPSQGPNDEHTLHPINTTGLRDNARGRYKIHGGIPYMKKLLTGDLNSAESAINACLETLETQFNESGTTLFHYHTKIVFLSDQNEERPVYKISRGYRGGSNTCTLFFYVERDQIRVIAMGQHKKPAKGSGVRPGTGNYHIHWSLPSFRLPAVIRLDKTLTLRSEKGKTDANR